MKLNRHRVRKKIRKAVVAIASQNDVIEHPDCEHLTALFEASRNFLILLTWHWVAGRMIVHTDYGGANTRGASRLRGPIGRRSQDKSRSGELGRQRSIDS